MWSTASPNHAQPEVLEVGNTESDALEQTDLAVHALNEAAGCTVREKN